jgi:hypothetical protein
VGAPPPPARWRPARQAWRVRRAWRRSATTATREPLTTADRSARSPPSPPRSATTSNSARGRGFVAGLVHDNGIEIVGTLSIAMADQDEDPDLDTPLPKGPLTSIAEVRRYLKYDLGPELESHLRVRRDEMNEATYTAIAWETLQRRVGSKFRIEIDESIPGTDYRADIVLYRNLSTGVIAIEVKRNAQVTGLTGTSARGESTQPST